MRNIARLAMAFGLAGIAAGPAWGQTTVWHSTRLLENATTEECMVRARAALQAQGYRLTQSNPASQYGVNGNATGLVICSQTATPVLVVVIAGAEPATAERHRNAIREAIMTGGRGAQPVK